jgi:ABC-type transport system substrate-binding protein
LENHFIIKKSLRTMKRILSAVVFAALVSTFATAQQAVTPAAATPDVAVTASATVKVGGPVMTFEKTEIDYGTIAQGADPLRRFKFKNTGTEPLVIKNARGSCGCTVPSFKKEPIAPGETSEIEVRYDTQRIGDFQKSVTIETNEGEQARVLMIKGHVNEKVAEAGVPVNAPSLISAPKQ